jgi:hypothetical protein
MPGFPKEEDHSGLGGWGMDLDRDSNPWADAGERGPPPGAMIPGTSGMPPPGAVHPNMAPGTPNAVPPPGSQVSTANSFGRDNVQQLTNNGAATHGGGQGEIMSF